jgi:hypothetical protein
LRFVLFLSSFLLLSLSPLNGFCADEIPAEDRGSSKTAAMEIDYELDPYYSNLGLHIPLTDNAIPDVGESDEPKVYKRLFLSSLTLKWLRFLRQVCKQ